MRTHPPSGKVTLVLGTRISQVHVPESRSALAIMSSPTVSAACLVKLKHVTLPVPGLMTVMVAKGLLRKLDPQRSLKEALARTARSEGARTISGPSVRGKFDYNFVYHERLFKLPLPYLHLQELITCNLATLCWPKCLAL